MNEPQFTRSNSLLAMNCVVEVNIRANSEVVWGLLTDAPGFPRWNSTLTGIEGQIREGERLKLHVPGTKRTFTPMVSGVVPGQRMIWGDGIAGIFKGVRAFLLRSRDDGSTDFTMKEQFSGVVFALTKGLMPDFGPIFVAYANDLKRESERIARQV